MLADTPKPPYYAVIFSSVRSDWTEGYSETTERMLELAREQPGFLGVESARNEIGITVSYWRDLDSIKAWKTNTEHLEAQRRGKRDWYSAYTTRICLVERAYGFASELG